MNQLECTHGNKVPAGPCPCRGDCRCRAATCLASGVKRKIQGPGFRGARRSRLLDAMRERGITAYGLAQRLGCSPSTVGDWLEGAGISASYRASLSEIFGGDMLQDYLLREGHAYYQEGSTYCWGHRDGATRLSYARALRLKAELGGTIIKLVRTK